MNDPAALSGARLLIADDDAVNLEIFRDALALDGYETECAINGSEALALLHEQPLRFDAILLDRMMPAMNGIEVTRAIRADAALRHLPIVMQTAAATREDILSGMEAGASYYLTKPVDLSLLRQIVSNAVAECLERRALIREILDGGRNLQLLQQAEYRFRTLDEARALAALLGKASAHPDRVAMGLAELMINAVEHGNLGIGYAEKSDLNRTGAWRQEVERRLALPENAEKFVTARFRRLTGQFRVTIIDQGDGFDWTRYLEVDPARAFDSHGRGIAMARKMSFLRLEYRADGREVEVTIAAD